MRMAPYPMRFTSKSPSWKVPAACAVIVVSIPDPYPAAPDHILGGLERTEVIVIGAGPAGLATGGALRHYGIGSVVIEGDQIGASWRKHYDRLRLHTVRWLSHLPGYKMPRRYGDWVARDDVVEYLEDYVELHNIDVRTSVEVEGLERDGDSWVVRTSDGDFSAPRVVIATGYNRHQNLP